MANKSYEDEFGEIEPINGTSNENEFGEVELLEEPSAPDLQGATDVDSFVAMHKKSNETPIGLDYNGKKANVGDYVAVQERDGKTSLKKVNDPVDGVAVLEDTDDEIEEGKTYPTLTADEWDEGRKNKKIRRNVSPAEYRRLQHEAETGSKVFGEESGKTASFLADTLPIIGRMMVNEERGKIARMEKFVKGEPELKATKNSGQTFSSTWGTYSPQVEIKGDEAWEIEAKHLGVDASSAKRGKDEDSESYRKRLRGLVLEKMKETVSRQDAAKQELEYIESDWKDMVFGSGRQSIGYGLEYVATAPIGGAMVKGGAALLKTVPKAAKAVGALSKAAPKTAKILAGTAKVVTEAQPMALVEAESNYEKFRENGYTMKNGALEIESRADDPETALIKAIANGEATAITEVGLGKVTAPVYRAIGKAIGKNAVGQAVVKVAKAYGKIRDTTKFGDIAFEELPEENIQFFFSDVLGWGKKDSEYNGFLDELNAAFSDGGQYTAKGQWNTALGMLLQMGGQAALAGGATAVEASADNRGFINTLVGAGMSRDEIAKLNFGQRKVLSDLYKKFYTDLIDKGKNPEENRASEELVRELELLGGYLGQHADEIVKKTTFGLQDDIAKYGEEPHQFEIQSEVGADGKPKPVFKKFLHTDGITGKKSERKEMFDPKAGVSIVENEDGSYEIYDEIHPERSFATDNFDEALRCANLYSLSNQKLNLDNRLKEEYAKNLLSTKYQNTNFEGYYTIGNLYHAAVKAINETGSFHGYQLNQIFKTDSKGEVILPPQTVEGGVKGLAGKDGTIVAVLDNIKTAKDMNAMFSHETKHLKATKDMLMRISPKSECWKYVEIIRKAYAEKGIEASELKIREEGFAYWAQQRGHNPSLMQRVSHAFTTKKGELNDADLEVIASRMEREGEVAEKNGNTTAEFIGSFDENTMSDSQALESEETQEEVGNETRTDEAPAQSEQAQPVTPSTGEEARPMEAGEAPSEVGGEVEAPILSGDEVRKTMPGYDPKNWRTHVDRKGDFVAPRMEARFQELLKTRKGKGNGEVVFLAGGNGSGKSIVANALGETPDFIIDSTLGNLAVAKKQIEAVIANGQKPVIDFVYRSPEQALEGVVGRVKNGGHAVSPVSFADSHTKGIKNLRLLADEYGDKISIRIVDNSVEGQPEISLEQLEAKGIPDYEELRKRANEALGQYDGRRLADESNKSSTSESGGGSESTRSDSKERVETPTSASTETQANTPPTTAESAEGVSDVTEGEKEPVSARSVIEKMTKQAPVEELPVAEVFNDDTRIPNFKEGANPETGEVEPLTGEPYDLVSNPIVVMEFKDGKKVVVTGRHRLALYKRSGRKTIAARVIKESDGWTVDDAKMIDSIGNIIDEKGSVKDYVKYFEDAKPTREAAESGGFLSRPKGRLAYSIYEGASADTRASIDFEGSGSDGQISVEQAGIIAEAAPVNAHPRNKALQRILVNKALAGLRGKKLGILARSLAEEVKSAKETPNVGGEMQLDLFASADDQALLAMEEKRADYRTKKSQEYNRIAEVLRTAMSKGGKLDLNKEYAKELGITDPKDKKQLAAARNKAVEKANYWENAVRLEDADKTAMDNEITAKADAAAKKAAEAKAKVEALKAKREGKTAPKAETPKPDPKEAAYQEWLNKAKFSDTPARRAEWERKQALKNASKKTARVDEKSAETAKTTEQEPKKAPVTAKQPSIKMKDEAAEKRAQKLEDELGALFMSGELNPNGSLNEKNKNDIIQGLDETSLRKQIEAMSVGSIRHPRYKKEEVKASYGKEHNRLWGIILSLEPANVHAGRGRAKPALVGGAGQNSRRALQEMAFATPIKNLESYGENSKYLDRGKESVVYKKADGKVIKVRKISAYNADVVVDELSKIVYHNYLFPKDAYVLKDFVVHSQNGHDNYYLILEQDFVEPKTNNGYIVPPSYEQIYAALNKSPERFSSWDSSEDNSDSSSNVEAAKNVAINGDYAVYDFQPGRNTFIDAKTGEIRFIDPRVDLNDPNAGFGYSNYGKRNKNGTIAPVQTSEDYYDSLAEQYEEEEEWRDNHPDFMSEELSNAVERRKDLIAFHNVSASGLKGMDDLGGMAVPSFAVTKDTIGGNEFGEITLLVRPDTIDPKRRGNKIYTGDAWTPSFPETRVKTNEKVIDKIQDRIFALMRNPANADAAKVASGWSAEIDSDNINDWVNRSNGNAVEALSPWNAFKVAYLLEKGKFNDAVIKNDDQQVDVIKSMNAVNAAIEADKSGYESWLKDLTEGITDGKKYIRNNKDLYTPSGNRRSFDALYDPLTLANAVKAMLNSQYEYGGGFLGRNPFGVAARKYNSLSDVIADENRLKNLSREEKKAIKEELSDRLSVVANEYNKTQIHPDRNGYTQYSRSVDHLMDSYVLTKGNKAKLLKELNQFGYTASEDLVDRFVSVMKDMSRMPEDYFEAKAYRGVGFDEVAAAVIPDNASDETKQILGKHNIPTYSYENGNVTDRLRAVNEAADADGEIRFMSEEFSPENYDIISANEKTRKIQDIAKALRKIESAKLTGKKKDKTHARGVYQTSHTGIEKRSGDALADELYNALPPAIVKFNNKHNSSLTVTEGSLGIADIRKLFNRLNTNPDTAALAEKVFRVAEKIGVHFSFEESAFEEREEDYLGMAGSGYVIFNPFRFSESETSPREKAENLLHETIHSVTLYALYIVNGQSKRHASIPISQELRDAVADLEKVYEETEDFLLRRNATNYAQTETLPEEIEEMLTEKEKMRALKFWRMAEFLAELSNSEVRKELQQHTLWTRIVNGVRKVINALIGMFDNNVKYAGQDKTDRKENALKVSYRILDKFLRHADSGAILAARDLWVSEAVSPFYGNRKRRPKKQNTISDGKGEDLGGGVFFMSDEFDPNTDEDKKRIEKLVEVIDGYQENGVRGFDSIVLKLAGRFPEKFNAMKPYLRAAWNIAMPDRKYTEDEAESVYSLLDDVTPENPLGQTVPPENGSVAQAIDTEIAEKEGLGGKVQGVPPAQAPGSAENSKLNPFYEPESIGAGVKNPIARQQIIDKFRELFPEVAIRGENTTRVGKNYAGHYEPNAGIVRSKDLVTLRTIPHEIGHHIDFLLHQSGPWRSPNVRADLVKLGKKLYGNKIPNVGYEAEGFAEIVKYYLQGNEAGLRSEAPDAYQWFVNDFGKTHPDMMAKLDALRDLIDAFQNQSGEDAVRAIRAKDPSFAQRAITKLSDMLQSVKPTQENWLDTGAFITKAMRASGINKLFDWRGAMERGDTAEMNDLIENHPVLKWKLYNGKAAARAYKALESGLTDLSGTRRYTYGDLGMATPGYNASELIPTFKEIFQDFSNEEMDEFQNYAIARIAKEAYLDKGLQFGLTLKEVIPTLLKHAKNKKFQTALEKYTHYKHGVLHLLVDSGAMSQEQFEVIVAANPIYVKIARRRESADLFRDTILKRKGKAVNKRTGSGRQVEDIFDAGLVDDERIFSAAFQADLLRSLVAAGNRAEAANTAADLGGAPAAYSVGANWLKEVPNAQGAVKFTAEKLRKQIVEAMQKSGQVQSKGDADNIFDMLFDDGKDTLTIFKEKPSNGKNGLVSIFDENGKIHTYELPEVNAEGWAKGLLGFTDATKPNILEQWLHIAASATRSGATVLNPTFALRNIVRDTLHASTVNEFGAFLPGASTVQGVVMDLLNTNSKKIFDAMGIEMGSMLGESKLQSARRANRYIMSRNWFEAQWNKGIKKAIADFVGFSENASRVKEFKNVRDFMLKRGASEKAADMLAGCNALDVTIDFQRGGEVTKAINRVIPFFNAGVQGLEQTARAFGLLRTKEWQRYDSRGKRAARTFLKGVVCLTMFSLLSELFNHSDDERKKKIAELKPHEKWNYLSFGDLRIPVPYEIGYIFSSIPRAVVAELYYGEEGAVKECLAMMRRTLPGLSPRDMAFVGPALEVAMNENWMGGQIIPDYVMRDKRSYDWYDARTSEFSKHLAKAFHLIFGDSKLASPAHLDYLLNGWSGNMYDRTIGAIGGMAEFDSSRPHTWPIVGTFFRNNATASRLVGDFYERRKELTRKKGSNEATVSEKRELNLMNITAEKISKLRKEMKAAMSNKALSVKERNDKVEKNALEMQEMVRRCNSDVDKYIKKRQK